MNSLNIITYNIWFETTNVLERTIALIETIYKKNPDVICLQEVRPEIYNLLIKQLQEYKYHFPKKINANYGCVIFSKFPITKCMNYDFKNSLMGRSLIVAKIDYPYHNISEDGRAVDKIDIVIANTHFESLFSKSDNDTKIKQFSTAKEILESLYINYKNVIFCSDSNVLPHEEPVFDNIFESNIWLDAWKLKGNDQNKFTYDNEENSYLKTKYPYPKKKYKSRFDRILIKSDNCELNEFNLLKSNNSIEPSDHFGLQSIFAVQIN